MFFQNRTKIVLFTLGLGLGVVEAGSAGEKYQLLEKIVLLGSELNAYSDASLCTPKAPLLPEVANLLPLDSSANLHNWSIIRRKLPDESEYKILIHNTYRVPDPLRIQPPTDMSFTIMVSPDDTIESIFHYGLVGYIEFNCQVESLWVQGQEGPHPEDLKISDSSNENKSENDPEKKEDL